MHYPSEHSLVGIGPILCRWATMRGPSAPGVGRPRRRQPRDCAQRHPQARRRRQEPEKLPQRARPRIPHARTRPTVRAAFVPIFARGDAVEGEQPPSARLIACRRHSATMPSSVGAPPKRCRRNAVWPGGRFRGRLHGLGSLRTILLPPEELFSPLHIHREPPVVFPHSNLRERCRCAG